MKKMVLLVTAVLFATFVFAQKTAEIPVTKLPKATTDYIKENLPGAKIVRAVKADDNGVITYNVGIDVKGRKHLLVFDKDGKFLKKGDALIPEATQSTKTTTPVQKAPPTSTVKSEPAKK